jgi:hypothetical protein
MPIDSLTLSFESRRDPVFQAHGRGGRKREHGQPVDMAVRGQVHRMSSILIRGVQVGGYGW